MTRNKTEQEYLALWVDVKSRLARAARLDPLRVDPINENRPKCRMIYGAAAHGYKVNPIPEEEIIAYETRYKLQFPTNFRTYMMVIGSAYNRTERNRNVSVTAGPGNGIYNVLTEDIPHTSDFYAPSPLEARKGIGWDDEHGTAEPYGSDEYAFLSSDMKKGTIEIGDSGNPCIFHLVVNGALRGDVFGFTGDMLFYEGSFEKWYLKWLDETLEELESGRAREKFQRRKPARFS